MARKEENNERMTTIVCAVVAIAILAAGVTARQEDSSRNSEPAQWESDVRYHLKTAFRHNARERDARLAQVEAVMAAWKASPQNTEDREKLIDWLSETVVRSIPGSVDELPPHPEFSQHESDKGPAVDPSKFATTLPKTPMKAPDLLNGATLPDVQVTPTPYDPFEIEEDNTIAEKPLDAPVVELEESIVLEQPPTVVPSQQRLANKNVIESNTLPSAPMPNSTQVHLDSSEVYGEDEFPSPTLTEMGEIPTAEPVSINLTELAARIAGYHDGLDEVETALLRADNASLDLVTSQAQRLDEMTRNYRFVRLYYDSLTEVERQAVLAPRPLSATLKEVNRQLDLYEASLDEDFLGSIDSAKSEQIAEIRELLTSIGQRCQIEKDALKQPLLNK